MRCFGGRDCTTACVALDQHWRIGTSIISGASINTLIPRDRVPAALFIIRYMGTLVGGTRTALVVTGLWTLTVPWGAVADSNIVL